MGVKERGRINQGNGKLQKGEERGEINFLYHFFEGGDPDKIINIHPCSWVNYFLVQLPAVRDGAATQRPHCHKPQVKHHCF